MKFFTSWFLLSFVGFLIFPGCMDGLDLKVSNPCDPAYTGDEVCPADVLDAGADQQADSGGASVDVGIHGGDVGGSKPDSGSCLCTGVSACCDGCQPTGAGEVCHDDGLFCTEHRCSAAGSCEAEVADGWCLVEGACHNIQTDPFHCGFCSNECGRAQVCFEGRCVSSCPHGYTDCAGSCFNLNDDPHNCGSCGKVCLPGEKCLDGSCVPVCPPGLTDCAGGCADLDSDPYHCGDCSVECSRSKVCANGECADRCLDDQVDCDGACVFLDSHRLHCGECGHGCHPEQVCLGGACVLPCDSGLTDCGGSCVSLLDSDNHCGECGLACPANGSCIGGECVVPVTGVTLSSSELSLTVGQSEQLAAIVIPENATDQSLIWTSSEQAVVSVSDHGLVTGVGSGAGTILVTTVDGGFVATCPVTVVVPVSDISISPPVLSLLPGEQEILSPIITPVDATCQEVTWESSHPEVATVTMTGLVEGVAPGVATITATTVDGGYQASCEVTVAATVVTGIHITPPAITITKGGGGVQLQVTVEPADATDQRVWWSSSDERVVVVNQQGMITGLAGGEATVTATSLSGGQEATCEVTVRVPVTGITVTPESLIIPPGGTGQLIGTISPEDASDKRVTWTTSDQNIATVSTTGLVSGHDAGYVSITVQTNDGGHAATANVRVGIPVTDVEVEPATLSLMPGDTGIVTAIVHPPEATEPQVVWTSSNVAVATVDDTGLVTGVRGGNAIITATTVDGDFIASCAIIVGIRVTGVTLSPTPLLVDPGTTGQLTAIVTPSNATDKTVFWTSANPSVARVNGAGLVTGVALGETTVTVTTNDGGLTASALVKVGVRVTGVSMEPVVMTILEGRTGQLTATVSPPNATDKSVVWSTSAQAVATVSQSGLVTGTSAGNATITATTTDGEHTAATQVTVTTWPDGYALIPAGTFTMGSPVGELGRQASETQHEVTITRSFLMKTTQVTQGEWQARMGSNPANFKTCGTTCPIERVNWYEALAYANALSAAEGLSQCFDCSGSGTDVICSLKEQFDKPQDCPGYRLPTEAEWEYAARAGSADAFHTGDITGTGACFNMDRAGWYSYNSGNKTHSVGGKEPNDWGLYDMHGNVLEWVWDWYGDYEDGSATDPYGPNYGSYRVFRGGSWRSSALNCRAGLRYYYRPDNRNYVLGFRLLRSL